MIQDQKIGLSLHWASLREVGSFFFSYGLRARRTKVFFLLSLLPVVMAVVFQVNQAFFRRNSIEESFAFTNIILPFEMQFLILILSLFYGTSVCSEEVESKTLTYLITRPLPKSAIITGKYAAYTFLVLSLTAIGLVSSFLVLNLSRLGDFQLFLLMMRYLGVLALGILCYTAFFTFLGTFLKKSVLAGLLFAFGWENVIQYFPGSTQRFAIVHYLKSLLPSMKSGKWSFLTFRLDPTPPGPAIVILLLIAAGFLGLACLVFVWKEYGFED